MPFPQLFNYFVYNFIRIHRTLRVTPAMAVGVTNRLWDVADVVAILEAEESQRAGAVRQANQALRPRATVV